nr:MAG TPA: hypothetical protein [Caudoviricetes sp.]
MTAAGPAWCSPVLHGCGSVLDRNPEPGFPARSAGGFRRAPALTWVDAFL